MGIMDMINSFLNPQEGYQDAGDQLQKYYQQAQSYQQPYAAAGAAQIPQLQTMESNLANPSQLQNQWAQGYSTSPYAQQLIKQATQTGNDEASSMGLMGSSAALNNVQTNASNIMQSDRQSYLNDLMDKYKTAVGIGQNTYNTGAGMAGNMANNAMTQGQGMAQSAYGAQNAPGNLMGNLIKMLLQGGTAYATGGMSGGIT